MLKFYKNFIFFLKGIVILLYLYYNRDNKLYITYLACLKLHHEEGGVIIMRISDIRIRKVKKEDGRLKAVASIIIEDAFVVHDIKIIDGIDGYFIAMPSRKTPDGEYKDIAHPLNSETRAQVCDAILQAYKELDELEK